MCGVMRPHRGKVYKGPSVGAARPFPFLPPVNVDPCGKRAPSLLQSRRVRGRHGVLEAAVPAAALAFAAAAAAPGSAAAPPSGLSHGAFHGIQQQRCCNRQRHLRIKHIPRFQ